jgi:hypothetical protein
MARPCKTWPFRLAASAMEGQIGIGQVGMANGMVLGSAGLSRSVAGLSSMMDTSCLRLLKGSHPALEERRLCAAFGAILSFTILRMAQLKP